MAKKAKGSEPLVVPIEWHYPEDLIGRYANQMLVQFSESECNLSFFEINPPVLLGDLEEARASVKSVKAVCVGRIVLALGRVPEFLKTLHSAWEQHSRQISQGEETDAGSPDNGKSETK